MDSEERLHRKKTWFFLIRRSFAETPVPALTTLYNTLVRPHLEYAIQACSPSLVADADCLEWIQWLAKLVKGFRRLSYEERLRRLSVHSLHRRRLNGDLTAAYNVLSGGLNLDPVLTTSSVTASSVTSFNRQLDSAWEKLFAEFPCFSVLVSPQTLNPKLRNSLLHSPLLCKL